MSAPSVSPRSQPSALRILVRCPNWLGDVVMATPGLRALRAAYPHARIVAQLPAPLVPLLEGSGFCNELWPLDSRAGGLAGWRRDVARIAEARFDLGIVIPESISSALLMRLGRVARVVGFARDPLRRALLHECVPAPSAWGRRRLVSRERFVLQLVQALTAGQAPHRDRSRGGPPEPDPARERAALRLGLTVTEAERARLERVLVEQGAASESASESGSVARGDRGRAGRAVLAPGASFGPSKCWPAEFYAELGDRLARRGWQVIVLGGPGESDRVHAVAASMQTEPMRLDGALDLGALKALLATTGLLVANDAGARHVAAAFGVPSLIFFGPTSVEKTPDNLGAIEVLESEHACRPCYRRVCPIDHRCLRSIGVDEAERAVDRCLTVVPGA